jgi:tRNA nucleotidyltransferase (CCA-adding enzyme)
MAAVIGKKLPPRLVEELKKIGAEGDRAGITVFLVGGSVRDLMLGVRNYDIDLVVEGDAISFARGLRGKMGGTLVEHRKFGTATLVRDWPLWLGPSLHPDNKFKVDIASARKEAYERPAALPTVEFSSLEEDLYRRDFTINAMAVNVNGPTFGAFVDIFGGRQDLKKGVIRVLHDRSFMDDPTRIFRAVRFEQRFGFTLEKHTEHLIKNAVSQKMFRRTENQRIRKELMLILKGDLPENAILRMNELHELRFIHAGLNVNPSIRRIFPELRRCVEWYRSAAAVKRRLDIWLINLMALLEPLTSDRTEDVLKKFVFTRSESLRVMSCKKTGHVCLRRLSSRKKMTSGEVYELLEPFSHEAAVYLMARAPGATARRRIEDFLRLYDGTRLRINGKDIEKAGIRPGPLYREILRRVLRRKLDGGLVTKEDEIRCMKELIEGRGGGV